MYTYTVTHIHTYVQIHIHAYKHTYMHTHIYRWLAYMPCLPPVYILVACFLVFLTSIVDIVSAMNYSF